MFRVLHKGIQISLPINVDNITQDGIIWQIPDTGDIITLKSGMLLALNEEGTVEPATSSSTAVVGFALLDAKGMSPWENIPAAASGLVAVTFGNCVVETDYVEDGLTINPGDMIYAGDEGCVTNSGSTTPIGVALTKSTPSDPLFQIAIYGGPVSSGSSSSSGGTSGGDNP